MMDKETAAPVVDEQATHEEDDQEFNSGFEPQSGAATETPQSEAAESLSQDDQPATEPEPPEYVQLTREQVQDLMAKAARIDELQSKIDVSFGRFGQKLKDVTDRLQTATPAGVQVEVTDEVVSDLAEEFPEMGGLVKKTLEKFASRLKGTAPAAALAAVDPALFEQTRSSAVQIAKVEIASETLDDTHEGWQAIVGLPDQSGRIPNTEFRQWLAKQPEPYQNRVNSTFSAVTVGKAIDAFRESRRKTEAQAAARKARLEAGVTPRGTGGHQAATRDDDDDFNAGFKS